MMEDSDSGVSALMEVEELETAVMRTHLALQQLIKERKKDKDFDVDDLPVGGVVSLSYSLLPEVRRQLKLIRNWLKETTTSAIKMEEDPANARSMEEEEDTTDFEMGGANDPLGLEEDYCYDEEEFSLKPGRDKCDNNESGGTKMRKLDQRKTDQKRQQLKISDRLQIIRDLESGSKQKDVAEKYGLQACSVSRIFNNREKIKATSQNFPNEESSTSTSSSDPSQDVRPGRHFPQFNSPIKNKKHASRKCRLCAKKKNRRPRDTVYSCDTCKIPLCIDPCFKLYHEEELHIE